MSDERKTLEVLWTVKQLANYLTVSEISVRRWIRLGTIIDQTKIVRAGRAIRIPRSEVERIAGIRKASIVNSYD